MTSRRLVGAILMVLSVGLGIYFIVGAIGLADEGISTSNRLLASNRETLSVCVQARGVTQDGRQEQVEGELDAALSSLVEIPREFEVRRVVEGCPAPQTAIDTPGAIIGDSAPSVVSPSEHRLFVYILTGASFDMTFGTEAFAVGPEEFLCEGDVCMPVTSGLYVRESASSGVWREGLLRGLYLLPAPANAETTIDWAACERGEQPHPDYTCDQYQEQLGELEAD